MLADEQAIAEAQEDDAASVAPSEASGASSAPAVQFNYGLQTPPTNRRVRIAEVRARPVVVPPPPASLTQYPAAGVVDAGARPPPAEGEEL